MLCLGYNCNNLWSVYFYCDEKISHHVEYLNAIIIQYINNHSVQQASFHVFR